MTDQFIKERLYLKGVSPKTIAWYKDSFTAFAAALDSKADIIQRIAELRNRGVKPVSVNTWLRCINAYFRWLHVEHGKPLLKIPKLKEEQKILTTLTEEGLTRLINFHRVIRPNRTNLFRAGLIALTVLDTGLRASEVLGLTKQDIDMENLVIKVIGKASKHRLVPFSHELRKSLFRFGYKVNSSPDRISVRYFFGTKNNTKVSVRNLERDFKILGQKLGITGVRFSPHTIRHTFSVSYLRNGGNLEYLRRILGHTSLSTTQKYLRSLGVEDLGAVHSQLSPLARR